MSTPVPRKTWRLARYHIPTQSETSRDVPFGENQINGIVVTDRLSFLELVSALNRQQPGVWQYWEVR